MAVRDRLAATTTWSQPSSSALCHVWIHAMDSRKRSPNTKRPQRQAQRSTGRRSRVQGAPDSPICLTNIHPTRPCSHLSSTTTAGDPRSSRPQIPSTRPCARLSTTRNPTACATAPPDPTQAYQLRRARERVNASPSNTDNSNHSGGELKASVLPTCCHSKRRQASSTARFQTAAMCTRRRETQMLGLEYRTLEYFTGTDVPTCDS